MKTEKELMELAKELQGNWRNFSSFAWDRVGHDDPEVTDPYEWGIVYTNNRDSDLLEQSNAKAIKQEMEEFLNQEDSDIVEEHHSHWAVGWVDGYAIRPIKNGKLTDVFLKWVELNDRLEDYPILDEDDFSELEYEDQCSQIEDMCRQHTIQDLPEDWLAQVFSLLWDDSSGNMESISDDDCIWALDKLGYLEEDE